MFFIIMQGKPVGSGYQYEMNNEKKRLAFKADVLQFFFQSNNIKNEFYN